MRVVLCERRRDVSRDVLRVINIQCRHWNKRCLLLELLYISWSLNVSIVHRYRHCNIRNECLRQIPLHKPQDRQKSYQISCRLELFLLAMIVDLAFYTKVLFDQAYCTSSL